MSINSTLIYSGNGCTTDSAVGWTYAYDAEGQLTSASDAATGQILQCSYDGSGCLIAQVTDAAASPVSTLFCYAGGRRIEERSLADNHSASRYFFDAPGSDTLTFRQQS